MKAAKIRSEVRKRYGEVARSSSSCCGGSSSCGCGSGKDDAHKISKEIGYSVEEMKSVPDGANLGLGCGNPVALSAIAEGDTVLDLGSGGGFDCFLASKRTGTAGRVIGVDMTIDMIEKARTSAEKSGYDNVDFRLGEIENLPVADNSVDVVISNCVINLSADKLRVLQETYRVMKPGASLHVSDIVLLHELPEYLQESVSAYTGCVAGASLKTEYLSLMEGAGFSDIQVEKEDVFSEDLVVEVGNQIGEKDAFADKQINPAEIAGSVVSISVSARKPTGEID
ncbi:MAG: arsenite methyltransferase [Spirochaetales bacterium]|jgi:arsenite methyltransferase|nr:arsenite methyltransferase [Spirochaetales bacterium]